MLFFNISIQRILKKKVLSSITVFNIDIIEKIFIEHQISILEWLLNYVTLESGVMAAENSAWINYISKYNDIPIRELCTKYLHHLVLKSIFKWVDLYCIRCECSRVTCHVVMHPVKHDLWSTVPPCGHIPRHLIICVSSQTKVKDLRYKKTTVEIHTVIIVYRLMQVTT